MGNDDIEREIAKHLQCIHDIALKILDTSETGQKAFVTAAGVLAAVIHSTTVDNQRDDVIGAATDAVRDHLRFLDELAGAGRAMN